MIPSKLENAILNGWADYKTVSAAFSTFATLPIPDNSTVIITSIKWYPFINPIIKRSSDGAIVTTWRDFFRYNEYQLKIDGKKSKNFLQYRNEFDFKSFGTSSGQNGVFNFDTSGVIQGLATGTNTGAIVGTTNQNGLGNIVETPPPPPPFVATVGNQNFDNNLNVSLAVTENINLTTLLNSLGGWTSGGGEIINLDDIINLESEFFQNFLPLQKRPIQQDVYFTCEEFIKLTVTRNAYINTVQTVYGALLPTANENPPPDGLQGVNVLLRPFMQSPSGDYQFYYPGSIKFDGNNANDPQSIEQYKQLIDPDFSIISDMQTVTNDLVARFPYQTLPLIEFGIVTINNTYWEKIKNS